MYSGDPKWNVALLCSLPLMIVTVVKMSYGIACMEVFLHFHITQLHCSLGSPSNKGEDNDSEGSFCSGKLKPRTLAFYC